MRTPKLLIVCDSHGAGYGGIAGFSARIARRLEGRWQVEILELGGVAVRAIRERLAANEPADYDAAILQIGNPDVHPRMPQRALKLIRERAGLDFVRDSLFAVPATLGVPYFRRLPLFLFRLALTRVYREFYATVDEIVADTTGVIELLRRASPRVRVLPIFEVRPSVYGEDHNRRAREVNGRLARAYPSLFASAPLLTRSGYGRQYTWDKFHFSQRYHDRVATHLIRWLEESSCA